MQDKLTGLIEKHCVWLARTVSSIEAFLCTADGDDECRSLAVSEALSLTHQITGSSGSVGFGDVSAAAAVLEEHLKMLHLGALALTSSQMFRALALHSDLKRAAEAVRPETSTLYGVNLADMVAQARSAKA